MTTCFEKGNQTEVPQNLITLTVSGNQLVFLKYFIQIQIQRVVNTKYGSLGFWKLVKKYFLSNVHQWIPVPLLKNSKLQL